MHRLNLKKKEITMTQQQQQETIAMKKEEEQMSQHPFAVIRNAIEKIEKDAEADAEKNDAGFGWRYGYTIAMFQIILMDIDLTPQQLDIIQKRLDIGM